MKIKHQEIIIDKDNPFTYCKLEREQYAEVLTDIVKSYADGFVLAIDNEWGTGKTTFVKMWQQHLSNDGFQTIYFNAWENDFDSNPLVALMSELSSFTTKENREAFRSIIKKGAVLTKVVLPALLKALIKRYLDSDAIKELAEDTTEGATTLLDNEIDAYINKKKTIVEFREELEKFIKKATSDKPLVFIIDELDRCRPDYAVEVLEQIKHFFSVEGIIFVLSIDKDHLAGAVKGFYGSEQINTNEYLRRFIDLEYSIPEPSPEVFSKYLFDYCAFTDFFSSEERKKYKELNIEPEILLQVAELLIKKSKTTLRQQEKIFGHTRLILNCFKPINYTLPHISFVLVFIKTMENEVYKKIQQNTLSLQELSDEFSRLFPPENESGNVDIVYVEALLLHLYNNDREYNSRENRLETNDDGNEITKIKSKLGADNNSLTNSFIAIEREGKYKNTQLKYLLNKINLIDPLIAG